MRRAFTLLTAAAAILVAACKDSTGPQGALSGHWLGYGNDGFALDYRLTDDAGTLKGNGTAYGPAVGGGPVAFDASGIRIDTVFTLRLTAAGKLAVNETGVLANDTTAMVSLDGSGFSYYPLTLYKQR